LGELRYEGAVDELAHILTRPSFARRAANDELRKAAAHALVAIGTPAALEHVASRRRGERCKAIRELATEIHEQLSPDEPNRENAPKGDPTHATRTGTASGTR
jgi:hypothetical protein